MSRLQSSRLSNVSGRTDSLVSSRQSARERANFLESDSRILEVRIALASKIALNSFWLLTGSMLIGSHILDFFGISVPVVQVGGGLVVMAAGWRLLQREDAEARKTVEQKMTQQDIANRAFYPLTLPLTVGPGSISVAITLGANHATNVRSLVRLLSAVIGPALVAVTIYLSYRFAERVAHALGENAMNVFVRLTSFILLCIGVQITWNGVHDLVGQLADSSLYCGAPGCCGTPGCCGGPAGEGCASSNSTSKMSAAPGGCLAVPGRRRPNSPGTTALLCRPPS